MLVVLECSFQSCKRERKVAVGCGQHAAETARDRECPGAPQRARLPLETSDQGRCGLEVANRDQRLERIRERLDV